MTDNTMDLRYDQLRDERGDDYEPANDYEDQMDGVRAGLIDPDSVYCSHGTFVGGWAGPDYMCGWCEDGISDEDYREMRRVQAEENEKRSIARQTWEQLNKDTEGMNREDAWAKLKAWMETEEGSWLFK